MNIEAMNCKTDKFRNIMADERSRTWERLPMGKGGGCGFKVLKEYFNAPNIHGDK